MHYNDVSISVNGGLFLDWQNAISLSTKYCILQRELGSIEWFFFSFEGQRILS
jgi:hypothetical protein